MTAETAPDQQTTMQSTRQMTEVRALRMLRAGDDLKTVELATGLAQDELLRLQRDVPATMPKPPRRCDYAACESVATASKDGWAFCSAHSAAHEQHKPGAPTEPVSTGTPTTSSPLGRLLEDASAHSVAKVRNLGARIETQLDQLRALTAEHDQAEKAKRATIEAKKRAKAEVEQLEQQLRDAKARLKTGRTTALPRSAADGTPAASSSRREPLPCRKGCGATPLGAQGRAAHERHCAGA